MTFSERLKYRVKVSLAYALYYAGVLHALQAVRLRRRAIVLMYHRVLTRGERQSAASHPALVVERETFARQMAVLKRRFTVMSVEEFAERMETKTPFPDSTCLITFDDGWRDNFTNALPALQQHGLPALVFLPVNYIGQRRVFWQEALSHVLTRAVTQARSDPSRRPALQTLLAANGLSAVLELQDADPRSRILDVVGLQKSLTRPAVDDLLRGLAGELDIDLEQLADIEGFMSWEQIDTMRRNRVSFGGHGVDHLLLTQVTGAEVKGEVCGARDVLQQRLGISQPTFSYPNGYWNAGIADAVRRAGYRLAFITDEGFVECDDDRFAVRRLGIHEDTSANTPMFLARILGLW